MDCGGLLSQRDGPDLVETGQIPVEQHLLAADQVNATFNQGKGIVALRNAKLELLKTFGPQAVPYRWAAYTLEGADNYVIPLGP